MRHRSHRPTANGQGGWVSLEIAFGALGLGVALVFCAGLLSLGLAQVRCVEAAGEIARQAARGDLAAVTAIESRLPESALILIETPDRRVVVTVSLELQPWGTWFPPVPLRAEATAVAEGGS